MNIYNYYIAYKIEDEQNRCNIIFALDDDETIVIYKYINKQTHHQILDVKFESDIKTATRCLVNTPKLRLEVAMQIKDKIKALNSLQTYTKIVVDRVLN